MNDIATLYEQMSGLLGNRLHEERMCPDGVGRYCSYENGSIHFHPEFGAFETHGAIREAWQREGWEGGWLGYPVSNEQDLNIMELYPISDDGNTFYPCVGRVSYFQYGCIYWLSNSNETGARKRPAGDDRNRNYCRNWEEFRRPRKIKWWNVFS